MEAARVGKLTLSSESAALTGQSTAVQPTVSHAVLDPDTFTGVRGTRWQHAELSLCLQRRGQNGQSFTGSGGTADGGRPFSEGLTRRRFNGQPQIVATEGMR